MNWHLISNRTSAMSEEHESNDECEVPAGFWEWCLEQLYLDGYSEEEVKDMSADDMDLWSMIEMYEGMIALGVN